MEWTSKALESACSDINQSLARLVKDADVSKMPVAIETSHFAMRHKRSTLMFKLGIVETVRRGGGPKNRNAYPRRSAGVTNSTYLIHRLSITTEELQELIAQAT